MAERIQYWCRGCSQTFTNSATANAHHDATGHHQSFRCQACGRPLSQHTVGELDACAKLHSADVRTGIVRIRNAHDPDGGFAIRSSVVMEVMKEDGTWLLVRGVCGVTIVVPIRDDLVTADIHMELAEVDMTAFPLQLIRPRWWHQWRRWLPPWRNPFG